MSIDGSFTLRPYSAFGSYDKQEQCSFVPIAQGGIFPGTNLQNRPKRTGAIRFELAGPTTHNTHTSTMQLDYTTLYFRSEIDRGEQKREISRLEEEKRQLRVQVISLQAELLQEREGSACAACTICTYTAYDETRTHTEEATMHMFDQDTVVTAEPKPIKLFHETEIEIEIETETEIETEEPITDAKELSEDMLVDASTEADTDAIDNHDDDQDPSEPPVDQCEEEQDVLLSNVSLESSSPPVASDDLLKGIMQDLLDENNIETTNDSKRKRNSETKSRPSSSPCDDETAETPSVTTRRSTRRSRKMAPINSPPPAAINEALQRSVRSNRRNQTTPLELNVSCEDLSPIHIEEPAAPEEQLVAVHSEEAPVHEKSKAHIQASSGTSLEKSPTIDEAATAGTPTGSITTRRSTRSRTISTPTDSPPAINEALQRSVRSNRRNQTTPLELNASCEGLSPIHIEEPSAPEEQLVAVHSEEAPVHEEPKAHSQASGETNRAKSPTIDEAATAGTPTGSITTRRSTRSRTISTPTDSPPAINEALQRSVRSNRRNQTTPLELNASCEGLSPIAVEEPAAPEEQLVAVHSEEAPVHEKSKAHIQASGGTSRAKSPTIDEATIAGTPTGSVTTRRSTRSRKIVETDSPAAAAAINDEAVRRRNIAAAPLDETQPRPKRQRKGLLATSFKAPALKKKKGKK